MERDGVDRRWLGRVRLLALLQPTVSNESALLQPTVSNERGLCNSARV